MTAAAEPVISAEHTAAAGLVMRWRYRTEGKPIITATGDSVTVHGNVRVDARLKLWIADAEHASELIGFEREDEAEAMATHTENGTDLGERVLAPRTGGQGERGR